MRRLFARSLLLLAATLHPLASPGGDLQDDLKARRARVLERLGPDSMLILWSAPARVYSRDVDYEYRQDSDFYYLTGIDQEDSTLVLMPGNEKRKEILFVAPKNPAFEHRQGRLLGREEATARSGIETVYTSLEFEPFVSAMLYRRPYGVPFNTPPTTEYAAFFKAVASGTARLSLVLEPKPGLSGPLSTPFEIANKVRERFAGVSIQDASDLLHGLRQVKTPFERKVLARSLEVSNEAHLAGMRAARPGSYEYEVKAAIEAVYRARGASGWGYPSIVGSGPNATILHYAKAGRRMEAGDLLLVDAACSYEGLTGDITRTYPVSGSFTTAQRDIYRIVLAAQDGAIQVAKVGVRPAAVHQKTVEVVKEGLLKLGLITDASGDQYKTWYTHGSVHFIGMDVHDVGDYDRPLEPGMAFVIEPGIYAQEGALDYLPKTPENAVFAEKVRAVHQKYKNIGVRIEDSFLLTESGLERLSAGVPRTIEEIEAFLKARPIRTR